MVNNQQIAQLLYKQLQGALTPEEEQELENWSQQRFSNRELLQSLNNEEELIQKLQQHMPENRQELRNRILEKVLKETRVPEMHENNIAIVRRIHSWKWIAAAVIAVAAAGTWFLTRQPAPLQPTIAQTSDSLPVIAPGRTGALLTLADGRTINLDSNSNDIIPAQGGSVVKMENGQLRYSRMKQKSEAISWNTIATANGRQFTIRLSDGTRVWLNAGSSLRYPAAFTGHERTVSITGEAYFEVAANKQQPFRITTADGSRIDVLGTAFNINAYANEPAIRATLLQGNIRVSKEAESRVLKPGQQAIVQQHITVRDKVDTEQVIAWKNGFFNLSGISLEELMRQLSRWYNIDVSMEADLPKKQFWGEIYRGENLSVVLKFLERSGIHFRMENNGAKLVLTK